MASSLNVVIQLLSGSSYYCCQHAHVFVRCFDELQPFILVYKNLMCCFWNFVQVTINAEFKCALWIVELQRRV